MIGLAADRIGPVAGRRPILGKGEIVEHDHHAIDVVVRVGGRTLKDSRPGGDDLRQDFARQVDEVRASRVGVVGARMVERDRADKDRPQTGLPIRHRAHPSVDIGNASLHG